MNDLKESSASKSGRGLLIVISGFSGSGKSTMVKKLISEHDGYSLSISATTRAPRTGEQDGRDYFFVSEDTFRDMISRGELLEYAQYVDNYYGTPAPYVLEEMASGRDVILEIEMQGALKVRKSYPEAVLIFITPPSAAELEKRLTGRGTESAEVIKKRLERAVSESEGLDIYDYIVINDSLDEAVGRLHALISSQHNRRSMRTDLISDIRRDLQESLQPGG